eukprot:CAMPEP_0179316278 /NCGR_PEP_ID=MMETSP0797-20121207/55583_1 /TAXON_ID=47934 /ORGANISM="Dinophysis acuminata, Strain DAEP01" /LENGTH=76 /DNA_ID=CAMNT_0021027005 /DNA_START=46 /DNA_END=273 /DNA_ORIENTATION=-
MKVQAGRPAGIEVKPDGRSSARAGLTSHQECTSILDSAMRRHREAAQQQLLLLFFFFFLSTSCFFFFDALPLAASA